MALPHAQAMDIVKVAPFGDELQGMVSTSLIKTQRLQLLHMVLAEHQDQPEHHVDEECVIHCTEGVVEVVMPSGVRRLNAGELVLLPAKQKHSLRARTRCAVLVTLVLRDGDAAAQGGSGAKTLQEEGHARRSA